METEKGRYLCCSSIHLRKVTKEGIIDCRRRTTAESIGTKLRGNKGWRSRRGVGGDKSGLTQEMLDVGETQIDVTYGVMVKKSAMLSDVLS